MSTRNPTVVVVANSKSPDTTPPNLTAYLTPPIGYHWIIRQITVESTSQNVLTATCRFDNPAGTLICSSINGVLDTADGSPVFLDNGRLIVVTWAPVAANDSATFLAMVDEIAIGEPIPILGGS